jgi:hypothetical protein
VQPIGDLATARILVIGHDPALQHSIARAEYAFFLELLQRPPMDRAQVRQKQFAFRLLRYLVWLAGRPVEPVELYVTSLCNTFLERRGRGVLYIPEHEAQAGVQALGDGVTQGQFRAILPMAEQTFYWLCKLCFIDQPDEHVDAYLANAAPQAVWSQKGLYKKTRGTPFVKVCGQSFAQGGTPVIPILHVNDWRERLAGRWAPNQTGMLRARDNLKQALASHQAR